MLSEIQNKQIKSYKKLAKKNKLCKYIATVMIVVTIILGDLLRHQKRNIIAVSNVCIIFLLFCFNTSFAPPIFHEASNVTLAQEDTESTFSEEPLTEELIGDIEQSSLSEDDKASLDDLIAQKEQSQTSNINIEKEEQGVVFCKDDWNLLLINKQHTIPSDYTFTLGTIKGSMQCDERIIEPLTEMFQAAKADHINLIVCSPYRDLSRQEFLFDRKMKKYMNQGYSYMDAYKTASVTVTVPGASEHQVGLAVDIISDSYSALDEGFGDTAAGSWLKEHSSEYGFILRYPKGKEEITGIQYEPWHFRYVGTDAAEIIMEQGITLEEFVENL